MEFSDYLHTHAYIPHFWRVRYTYPQFSGKFPKIVEELFCINYVLHLLLKLHVNKKIIISLSLIHKMCGNSEYFVTTNPVEIANADNIDHIFYWSISETFDAAVHWKLHCNFGSEDDNNFLKNDKFSGKFYLSFGRVTFFTLNFPENLSLLMKGPDPWP